jgi:hypothetical protein
VASNIAGGFTVGEPSVLTLTLFNTGPVAAIGTELTFELPASFIVDPDISISTAWSDPEEGSGWTSGNCSVSGTTVTCEDVNLYSTTDADPLTGGYRFVGVTVTPTAAGNVSLSADLAPGPDQAEPAPNVHANSWSDTFTVAAATNGSIVGTVTAASGAPIGGVTVAAFSPTDTTTPTASGVSDGAGQYVLSNLPPADYDLRYSPPGPSGYAVQWYRGAGVASGRANAEGVNVPSTGAVVTAGEQLEDLDTSHVDLGGGSWEPTDPEFVIAGDTVQLEISPGYRRWQVDGVTSALPAASEFTIDVPSSVQIESAVQYRGAGGGNPVGTCTVTDHQAVCDIPDPLLTVLLDVTPAQAGSVGVTMTHTSAQTQATPDGLAASDTQLLDVRPATGTISGVITDSLGAPVQGAWVLGYLPTDLWVPAQSAAWAVTGADGTYTFAGVEPGTYRIAVFPPAGLIGEWYSNATGRATATPVELFAAGTVGDVDVSLARTASVSGTVSSAGGPVAGTQVVFYTPTDRYMGSYGTVTAADGTFTMPALPPNTYRIRLAPPSGSGLAGEWYEDAASRTTATPIVVAGTPITGITATLG